MDYRNDYKSDNKKERYATRGEAQDPDLVYSKAVKAGKRTYFIDVKRDRRGECYLQLTESKRQRDPGPDGRPVYEKHKIFLYREDFDKFQSALNEAAAVAAEQMPEGEYFAPWRNTNGSRYADDTAYDVEDLDKAIYDAEHNTDNTDLNDNINGEFRFNVDF